MPFFLCKLNPPRPTFAQDMTPTERQAMMEHVGYWTDMLNRGIAIVFGPVADPKGAWGVGIVEVPSEEAIRSITATDPAILANIGLSYELFPMPNAVFKK